MENEITGPVEHSVSVHKPRKRTFKIIRVIFVILMLLILLAGIWIGIAWMQKVPSRSAIPSDYSVFMHTDSAYKTFDHLLDLQVTDLILSSPGVRGAKFALIGLKNSKMREKKLFRKITSRKTDLAFYSDENGLFNYIAVIDMGPYAALTRLSPLYLTHVHNDAVKDIEYVKEEGLSYFRIQNDGAFCYFKPYKNLVIASGSKDLFVKSMEMVKQGSDTQYEEEKDSSDDSSLKIEVKPHVLFRALTGRNIITQEIDGMLDDSVPAYISLDVDDSKINVDMKLPIDFNRESHFSNLIARKSTVPSFGSKLSRDVTSCTLLNMANLSELKDAMFPLFPKSDSLETLWSGAQKVCRVLLGMTLDDILFKWSGQEIAVLGVKGCEQTVFAVEVADENERDRVFKKMSSSLFVKNEASVTRYGAKLNHLMLPSLVDKLLSVFKISLPSPYYFVQDGFIYLSQSPEALSKLYVSEGAGSEDEESTWDKMEGLSDQPSSISVYYDLAQKTPFFLKGNNSFAQALSLYGNGRCSIAFDSEGMNINLYACK